MMSKPDLTRRRIVVAYVVAVVADLLELPVTAAQFSIVGMAAGESAAFVVDSIVFVVMTKLLGFHWMFLPSFCIGLIPGLDMLPTWVGCVFFAVRQRRKEQNEGNKDQIVIEAPK